MADRIRLQPEKPKQGDLFSTKPEKARAEDVPTLARRIITERTQTEKPNKANSSKPGKKPPGKKPKADHPFVPFPDGSSVRCFKCKGKRLVHPGEVRKKKTTKADKQIVWRGTVFEQEPEARDELTIWRADVKDFPCFITRRTHPETDYSFSVTVWTKGRPSVFSGEFSSVAEAFAAVVENGKKLRRCLKVLGREE